MRKVMFAKMVDKLRPVLEEDHTRATASSDSPVTTELLLSMTLRWLAGTCIGACDVSHFLRIFSPSLRVANRFVTSNTQEGLILI